MNIKSFKKEDADDNLVECEQLDIIESALLKNISGGSSMDTCWVQEDWCQCTDTCQQRITPQIMF